MMYTKGFSSGVSLDDRGGCWPGFEGRIQVYAHKGKERTLQKDQDSEEMQEHAVSVDWACGWSGVG